MLRACRKALRPGGCLAFYTIMITEGLTETEYRQALRSAPSAVSSRRRDHVDMLETAGFTHVEQIDLTPEFGHTTRGWYEGRERFRPKLIAAEGEATFQERQADSAAQLKAIEGGLLRRSLFVAHRP